MLSITVALFHVFMHKQCTTVSDSYSMLYFHQFLLLRKVVKLFCVLNYMALPIQVLQEKLKVTEVYILFFDLTTKGTLQAKQGNVENIRLTLH